MKAGTREAGARHRPACGRPSQAWQRPITKLVLGRMCAGSLLAFAAVLSLGPALCAQDSGASGDRQISADQLVRRVIENELHAQDTDHSRWRFRETDAEGGRTETREIVRTNYGDVDRLLELDGRPLTADQIQAEEERIHKLVSNPDDIQKDLRARHQDYERERHLLGLFPDAFRYTYDGEENGLTRLQFIPSSNFHPQHREGRVFHHLVGTMLIDRQHMRLAGVDGKLTTDVEFLGGLLGHLDSGGTFSVRMQDVGGGHWRITLLKVHMNGRALLFKTISVKEDEMYADYHPIAPDMTLQQAADLLENEPVVSQVAPGASR